MTVRNNCDNSVRAAGYEYGVTVDGPHLENVKYGPSNKPFGFKDTTGADRAIEKGYCFGKGTLRTICSPFTLVGCILVAGLALLKGAVRVCSGNKIKLDYAGTFDTAKKLAGTAKNQFASVKNSISKSPAEYKLLNRRLGLESAPEGEVEHASNYRQVAVAAQAKFYSVSAQLREATAELATLQTAKDNAVAVVNAKAPRSFAGQVYHGNDGREVEIAAVRTALDRINQMQSKIAGLANQVAEKGAEAAELTVEANLRIDQLCSNVINRVPVITIAEPAKV